MKDGFVKKKKKRMMSVVRAALFLITVLMLLCTGCSHDQAAVSEKAVNEDRPEIKQEIEIEIENVNVAEIARSQPEAPVIIENDTVPLASLPSGFDDSDEKIKKSGSSEVSDGTSMIEDQEVPKVSQPDAADAFGDGSGDLTDHTSAGDQGPSEEITEIPDDVWVDIYEDFYVSPED